MVNINIKSKKANNIIVSSALSRHGYTYIIFTMLILPKHFSVLLSISFIISGASIDSVLLTLKSNELRKEDGLAIHVV